MRFATVAVLHCGWALDHLTVSRNWRQCGARPGQGCDFKFLHQTLCRANLDLRRTWWTHCLARQKRQTHPSTVSYLRCSSMSPARRRCTVSTGRSRIQPPLPASSSARHGEIIARQRCAPGRCYDGLATSTLTTKCASSWRRRWRRGSRQGTNPKEPAWTPAVRI